MHAITMAFIKRFFDIVAHSSMLPGTAVLGCIRQSDQLHLGLIQLLCRTPTICGWIGSNCMIFVIFSIHAIRPSLVSEVPNHKAWVFYDKMEVHYDFNGLILKIHNERRQSRGETGYLNLPAVHFKGKRPIIANGTELFMNRRLHLQSVTILKCNINDGVRSQ